VSSAHSAGGAQRYALLSVGAAIATISLKLVAWHLTKSVGLLSDAVESVVNLLAAVVALWALRVAAEPPDSEHHFGHSKAEYLASAFEGIAILGASVAIAVTAWGRIADPKPIESAWLGLAVSTVASAINGGVAFVLFRAGKRLDSITLRSDAHHLMTDVWTSVGVVAAVLAVAAVAPTRGRLDGPCATDHAPVRSKNTSGDRRYFEYAAVCTRNSSSG